MHCATPRPLCSFYLQLINSFVSTRFCSARTVKQPNSFLNRSTKEESLITARAVTQERQAVEVKRNLLVYDDTTFTEAWVNLGT